MMGRTSSLAVLEHDTVKRRFTCRAALLIAMEAGACMCTLTPLLMPVLTVT